MKIVSGFIPSGKKLNSGFELALIFECIEVIHLQAEEFRFLVSGGGIGEEIIDLIRAWTGVFRVGEDPV